MAWTPGSPFIGVEISTNVSTKETLNALNGAVEQAFHEVFEGPILDDAKAKCPVGTDPIEPGSERNRESLGVMVWTSPRGPMGKLYSSSGHGGFVEVGTSHMSAQPYAWPALQANIPAIMEAIKTNLGSVDVKLGRMVVMQEFNLG